MINYENTEIIMKTPFMITMKKFTENELTIILLFVKNYLKITYRVLFTYIYSMSYVSTSSRNYSSDTLMHESHEVVLR